MDIGNIDNHFLKQEVAETPDNGSIILDNYEEFSYHNKDTLLLPPQAQYCSLLDEPEL